MPVISYCEITSYILAFNSLPPGIKCLSKNMRFKSTLKKFLLEGSFYTIQEFFDCFSTNNPNLEKFYQS